MDSSLLLNHSDEEVIKKYLESKDSSLFTLLYQRYSKKVFGKCIFLLKEENLANDATQEIFLKIYLNLPKFKFNSKFSTWIFSITYNFCIDFLRKRKIERNLFTEVIENVPDQKEDESFNFLEIKVNQLKVVLDKIPPGDKSIILMKYRDSMSIRDISRSLSKSESAIKMKLKRAKLKARTHYIEAYM